MANFFSNFLTGIFGSRNQRLLKRYQVMVRAANAFEEQMLALDDAGLRARTDELKARYQAEGDLDALLPEAFAVVREAARRALGMRHFDVQLIGGITLHRRGQDAGRDAGRLSQCPDRRRRAYRHGQ